MADRADGQKKPDDQDRAAKLHKIKTTERLKYAGVFACAAPRRGGRAPGAGPRGRTRRPPDLRAQLAPLATGWDSWPTALLTCAMA